MPTIERQPICIVGTGARTPVGLDAPSTAAAARAGVAMMKDHPFMLDKRAARMVVCADPSLPIELEGTDRLLGLALAPAREALRSLLEKSRTPPRISVFVALPEQRPGRQRNLESTIAERFGSAFAAEISIQDLECYPLGHAGGIYCMEKSMFQIRSGRSQICLVGGIDSYLQDETLEWLDAQDQLHSETTIWGICPGEAAGFCLLASPKVAETLGLSVSVELLSVASATEVNRIKTETVCIGEGLSKAFNATLAALPTEHRVNHTICDMNGEPYRANEYGFAVLRSPGKFADDSDFETPADCWGDVGAASGPLFAVLAAFGFKKGYAPGPLTFLWASSECGLRAAALLQARSLT